MNTRILRLSVPFALGASLLMADFKYEQRSRMTGGSMMAMMKLAGRFSKSAREAQDITSTIAVKGNRMVNQSSAQSTIYDLDQGTITTIDTDKKTYSVVTFEQMKAFLDAAMKKSGGVNANLEMDIKETGRKETVLGLPSREVLMAMKVEGADPQSGKKGEMKLEMSNWMTDRMPGQEELAAFQKKMAERFVGAGFGAGMFSNQPGMSAGMAEAARKIAAMNGTNILQIVRMIPTDPEQIKQMEQSQASLAQMEQTQMPSAKGAAGDAAGQAAAGAAAGRLGRIGGLAGGLGGFGGLRRKKEEAAPPPPPAPAAPAAPAEGAMKGSFSSEVSLMEMTIESTNFSTAPVDAALFSVPAGFKQVKSPMEK